MATPQKLSVDPDMTDQIPKTSTKYKDPLLILDLFYKSCKAGIN